MSFITEDKNLFSQLLATLVKDAQAQVNPAAVSVAKKLVNKLQRQYAGTPEPTNITAAVPTELTDDYLKSLGTLLKYMDDIKLNIDGARVAFNKNEYDTLSKDERNKLSPVTINVGRISNPGGADDRKFITADYYTNLPLLIKFVGHLQQKAKEMGPVDGKVLDVYVGKLIDQVNAIKKDSGLARKPKSEPGQPQEIPDGTLLDDFGTKVFDLNKPTADRGSQQLKSENIKTWQALNAWLQDGPMAQVVSYDDKKQAVTKKYDDPSADKCIVIHVLYARAKHWHDLSKNEDEARKYSYYMKKLQEIGPSFTGPDGKSCSIAGSNSITVVSPNADQGGAGSGGGKLSTTEAAQVLSQMISALPLSMYNIDFHRIDYFFELYNQLLSKSNDLKKSEVQKAINEARVSMQNAKALTVTGQSSFNTFAGPAEVVGWLQPPQGDKYMSFLGHLQRVLLATKKVLDAFYGSYVYKHSGEDRVIFNSEQKAAIEAQILGDNSIFTDNWDRVGGMAARRSEVISFK